MGADIYLNSVYDRRSKEFKIDRLYKAFCKASEKSAEPSRPWTDPSKIDAARKAWLEAFEKADEGCYFRDMYNQSNLAWLCGLSYWHPGAELVDGVLPVYQVKVWRDRIAGTHITAAVTAALAAGKRNKARPPADPKREKPELTLADGESIENVVKFFLEKQRRFVALMDAAIALDEGLVWSV